MTSFLADIFYHLFHFIFLVQQQFLDKYIYGFSIMKALELSVFILGFFFIHLIIKENHYAWLIAAYNCSILSIIYIKDCVIGMVILHMFYVGNALFAFFRWRKKDLNNKPVVKLKWLNWKLHLVLVTILFLVVYLCVMIIQYLKKHYGISSEQTVRGMFVLIFSIFAVILQVKKNIEGMVYFTIVDIVIFFIHIESGNLLLAIVRGYITVLSGYGSIKWIFKYQKEKRLSQTQHLS